MIVRNTCGLTPNEIESVSIVNLRQQIWEEPGFFRDERDEMGLTAERTVRMLRQILDVTRNT